MYIIETPFGNICFNTYCEAKFFNDMMAGQVKGANDNNATFELTDWIGRGL